MPAIARVGDSISCGDHIAKGSPDVFINNMPAARLDDKTTGHGPFAATVILEACSETVFINDMKVAVLGNSKIQRHCVGPSCHDGVVSVASADVFADK